MRRSLSLATLSALALLAACSASQQTQWTGELTESVQSATIAVQAQTLTPMPATAWGGTSAKWGGTVVDLLAADAIFECGLQDNDSYLQQIWTWTSQASCPGAGAAQYDQCEKNWAAHHPSGKFIDPGTDPCLEDDSIDTDWFRHRNIAQCNVDIYAANTPKSAGLARRTPENTGSWILNAALRNLCVAQTLTAGGGPAASQGLLLSSAEQVQLNEIVRERAQKAILDFGIASVGLATLPSSRAGSGDEIGLLVSAGASVGEMNALGDDFAAAVELHVNATTQLLSLFSKSAAARLPVTSTQLAPADETWGPLSWRQRSLALLYGGPPIGVDQATAYGTPLVPMPARVGWPYATVSVQSPQLWTFFNLAKGLNVLDLKRTAIVQTGQDQITDLATGKPSYVYSTEWTNHIDQTATASRMYLAVEAGLRTAACTVKLSNGKCRVWTADDHDFGDPSTYLLTTQYAINSSHVANLVAMLDENIGWRNEDHPTPQAGSPVPPPTPGYYNPAPYDFVGAITQTISPTSPLNGWDHLSADAQFVPKSSVEAAPLYASRGQFHIPDRIDPNVSQWWQGIASDVNPVPQFGYGMVDRQWAGAASALAEVRNAIENAQASGQGNAAVAGLLKNRAKIQNLITGAIGEKSVSIYKQPASGMTCNGVCFPNLTGAYVVAVVANSSDPFWSGSSSGFKVYAVPDDHLAASHVLSATMAREGQTLATMLAGPNVSVGSVVGTPTTTSGLTQNLTRYNFVLNLKTCARHHESGGNCTIIAQNPAGKYQLLADNESFSRIPHADYIQLVSGESYTMGGSFQNAIANLYKVDPTQPTKPVLDPWGLPLNRVPTLEPAVLGLAAGASVFDYYKTTAQTNAATASTAVTTAFNTLLAEEQGSASQQNEETKSLAVAQQQVDKVCGTGNRACDTSTSTYEFKSSNLPACTQGATGVISDFNCFVAGSLGGMDISLAMPTPVVTALKTGLSDFSAYTDGDLRRNFERQYAAAQKLNQQFVTVWNGYVAASQALAAAQQASEMTVSVYTAQVNMAKAVCQRVPGAFQCNTQKEANCEDRLHNAYFYEDWCRQLQAASAVDLQNALAAQAQNQANGKVSLLQAFVSAVEGMDQGILALLDDAAAIQDLNADARASVRDAQAAIAQQQLEAQLAANTNVTRFGLYRTFHSQDTANAILDVDIAKKSALDLRRAIEAMYVIDLTSTYGTQVADSPIFDYNFGTAGGAAPQGGLVPDQTTNYVNWLLQVQRDYVLNHPFAVETAGTTDVISIPGPTGTGTSGNMVPPALVRAGSTTWSIACNNDATHWFPFPASGFSTACSGTAPTMAAVTFTLDPWGAVVSTPNATVANSTNFNERWKRLAINILDASSDPNCLATAQTIGSCKVVDCTRAMDKTGCNNSNSLPYNLTHNGPAWVSDYNGAWTVLGVPITTIAGAQAFDDQRWFNLTGSWTQPDVQQSARVVFENEPLGGTYTLTFPLGPEAQPQNIERIQVLVDKVLWAKQQGPMQL
jgi:hypothetical protein